MGNSFTPKGYSTVSPYLIARDAKMLLDQIVSVFDGERRQAHLNDDGTLMHGEVRIGDTVIMLGEASMNEPMKAMVHVYVPDADATYRRALDAGFTSLEEPLDTPYGERRAGMTDTNGNQWYVATVKG